MLWHEDSDSELIVPLAFLGHFVLGVDPHSHHVRTAIVVGLKWQRHDAKARPHTAPV